MIIVEILIFGHRGIFRNPKCNTLADFGVATFLSDLCLRPFRVGRGLNCQKLYERFVFFGELCTFDAREVYHNYSSTKSRVACFVSI